MSDKAYRLSVVILLALILGVQAFGQFYKPSPSEECLAAMKQATTAADLILDDLKDIIPSYQSEVYERAENINQQILLSSEHSFHALTYIGFAEQASLNVQMACK